MFSTGAKFVIAWYLTLDHPTEGFERNIRYQFGDHLSDRVLKEIAMNGIDIETFKNKKVSEVALETQKIIEMYSTEEHEYMTCDDINCRKCFQ